MVALFECFIRGALLKCRNKYHCGHVTRAYVCAELCTCTDTHTHKKQVQINAACGQNTQQSYTRFGLLKSSRIWLCAKVNFVRTCTTVRTDDGGRTTKVRPKKAKQHEAQKKLNGALAISACGTLHPCSLYWIRFPRFWQSLNLYFLLVYAHDINLKRAALKANTQTITLQRCHESMRLDYLLSHKTRLHRRADAQIITYFVQQQAGTTSSHF